MPERLDPVVEAALADLTNFVFRDDPRNGEVLNEHNSRAAAVHLFKHLKHHGHRWGSEPVRVWAWNHGRSAPDAEMLAGYARGVEEGVRYHTTPDPFGRHAYGDWREAADDSPQDS